MDAYTAELARHGLEQVEREVEWLERVIDTERGTRGALDYGGIAGATPDLAQAPPVARAAAAASTTVPPAVAPTTASAAP
ncbi:hypothetical protein NL453_27370, partial [Klebsiella pneumoniae]|nr:hypothetical protein [Klebsiella pneumoniae]